MMTEPLLLSWSGGKDCALALHVLREEGGHRVAALLTTVTAEYDRVAMHGVRRVLLERQAEALGLPLEVIELPPRPSNEAYDAAMHAALERWRERGVRAVAFGDLFLEEIRRYREARLEAAGMQALFPLWGEDTGELAERFLSLGHRAVLTCVDSQALDGSFAGREYDAALLADLPSTVDPCGENGEFHTFTYSGPTLRRPLAFRRGEVVLRDDRFYFCDLLPA